MKKEDLQDDHTPLLCVNTYHSAIKIGNQSIMQFLLSKQFVRVDSVWDKRSPLIVATFYDQFQIAEFLINLNANVNSKDPNGNTPLHFAISSPTIVNLLIQKGANVNAQNEDGETPVYQAVKQKKYTIT